MSQNPAVILRNILAAAALALAFWPICRAQLIDGPVTVESADVVAELNPAVPFLSLGWKWSLECAGESMGILSVPEAGLSVQGKLRFAKVADPAKKSSKVLLFRAARSDPLVYGAPRCEATASPTQGGALPVGQPFWFAFGIRLDGWIATADEQIIAQWHHSDDTIVMNPFLAISVASNEMRIVARYNANDPVSKESTTSIRLATSKPLPVDRWSYFVVKALISPDGSLGSFVKVWRNGVQIADYFGPFGYRLAPLMPFLKVGHYHWIDASNPWPDTVPVRSVLMRTPVLVHDGNGRYSEPDLRAYVVSR